jgi:hypothetical protein
MVQLYLNSGGESFGDPIELGRTPRLGTTQFLMTDMNGQAQPVCCGPPRAPPRRPTIIGSSISSTASNRTCSGPSTTARG